jgi:hypothetical protein
LHGRHLLPQGPLGDQPGERHQGRAAGRRQRQPEPRPPGP